MTAMRSIGCSSMRSLVHCRVVGSRCLHSRQGQMIVVIYPSGSQRVPSRLYMSVRNKTSRLHSHTFCKQWWGAAKTRGVAPQGECERSAHARSSRISPQAYTFWPWSFLASFFRFMGVSFSVRQTVHAHRREYSGVGDATSLNTRIPRPYCLSWYSCLQKHGKIFVGISPLPLCLMGAYRRPMRLRCTPQS